MHNIVHYMDYSAQVQIKKSLLQQCRFSQIKDKLFVCGSETPAAKAR